MEAEIDGGPKQTRMTVTIGRYRGGWFGGLTMLAGHLLVDVDKLIRNVVPTGLNV